MLRVLAFATTLLVAGCARSIPPNWIIESEEAGTIKVRLGDKAYTGICEHYVLLDTHTVHQGTAACEISPTIAGKSVPAENRERDSNGQVVVTKLTIVKQEHQVFKLVLRRYFEGDRSGGVYESFQIIPLGYRPPPPVLRRRFIRPDYINENA